MTVATEISVTAVAGRLDDDVSDFHYKVDRASGVFEMYELSLHRHPRPGAPTFIVFYERDGKMSEIVKTSVADGRGEHVIDTRELDDAPSVLIGLRLILEDVLETAAGDELMESIASSLAETIDSALQFPARVAL